MNAERRFSNKSLSLDASSAPTDTKSSAVTSPSAPNALQTSPVDTYESEQSVSKQTQSSTVDGVHNLGSTCSAQSVPTSQASAARYSRASESGRARSSSSSLASSSRSSPSSSSNYSPRLAHLKLSRSSPSSSASPPASPSSHYAAYTAPFASLASSSTHTHTHSSALPQRGAHLSSNLNPQIASLPTTSPVAQQTPSSPNCVRSPLSGSPLPTHHIKTHSSMRTTSPVENCAVSGSSFQCTSSASCGYQTQVTYTSNHAIPQCTSASAMGPNICTHSIQALMLSNATATNTPHIQSILKQAEKHLQQNEANDALTLAANLIASHREAVAPSSAVLVPAMQLQQSSLPRTQTSVQYLSRSELESAHLLACKSLVQMAAWQRAYAACRDALALLPQNHELLHLSGKVLVEFGRPVEAVALFSLAIDAKPDHLPSWLARGLTYHLQLKDSARAVSDFHTSIVLNPTYYKSFFYMGMVMTDLRRYDLAAEAYDRSIHLNSSFSESYFRRGVLHLQHHHLELAVEDFSTVTKMVPESAEAHYNRALALHLLKKNEDAIQSYQFCLQYQPDYVNALKNCAHAQTELGMYPEAFEKYSTALTLPHLDNDTKLDILLARGQVCERNEDVNQALSDYTQAIALRPTLGRAFSYRGLLHLSQSNASNNALNAPLRHQGIEIEENQNQNQNVDKREAHLKLALDDFSKALELEPENARAWNNRGTARLQARFFDFALEDFDRALRLWPVFTKALRNKGKALYLKGQHQAALDALEAAAHSPNSASDPETHLLRGTIHCSMGDSTKALKDFSRAQEPIRKRHARQEQTDMLNWLQLDLLLNPELQ